MTRRAPRADAPLDPLRVEAEAEAAWARRVAVDLPPEAETTFRKLVELMADSGAGAVVAPRRAVAQVIELDLRRLDRHLEALARAGVLSIDGERIALAPTPGDRP